MPKLSQIPAASSFTLTDTLVGVRNNGDGTFTDYLYTGAQVMAFVSANNQAELTITIAGTHITNDFFVNPISLIVTNGQAYIANVDFTQVGETLTFTNGASYTVGQVVLFKM